MKKFNIAIILIFVVSILLRIGIISQKDDLFFDEVLNMTASHHNEFYLNRNNYFEFNKEYSGYDLKQKFLIDKKKDTLHDIISLRKTSGDVLHTNLYYSLFRLIYIGADDYNLNSYLIRAGFLNLALFSLSFFFMFKLLSLLFDDRKYVAIGLVIAFLNPAAISNSIFFREYQLQEVFLILLTYLGVYFHNNLKSYKQALIISIITALSLLSGYYIGIFVTIIYLSLLNKKNFKYVLFSAICSILLLLLMYPEYFGFFFSKFVHSKVQLTTVTNTAITQKNTNSQNLFIKLFTYPLSVYHYICSYLLLIYFTVLAFIGKGINKKILTISILAILWTVIVLFTCPYKVLRYALPAIPLCTIILTWILARVNNNKYIVISLVLLLMHVFFVTNNTFVKNKGMHFTNIKIHKEFCFENNSSLPVYIKIADKESIGIFLTHVNDSQKYIFINNDYKIKDKHFYLIFDASNPINYALTNIKALQNITSNYILCAEILQ